MFETTALDSVANRYVDKDVGTSTPGTRLEADDRNIEMDELVNAVEGAGLTLDPTGANRNQLLEAMTILGLTTKNAIINGAMLHAQRGASGSALFDSTTTPANNDDTYLVDRHINLSDGNDVVDISQSTDAPVGSLLSYSMDVETINKKFGWFHIIEQRNCQHMIGGNVSLSFEARVTDITKLDNIKAMILSWDGAADAPTSDIISAWNAEDTDPTLVANWTAENTPADLGVTATWAKYKIENIAIDTAATKNIGVFIWSDGFCDTLGTMLRITNVQLEKNSIATDFEWRDVGQELALCQRHYYKTYNVETPPGAITGAGHARVTITAVDNLDHEMHHDYPFPVSMFANPTVTLYSPNSALTAKVAMASGDVAGTAADIGKNGVTASGTNGGVNTGRTLRFQLTAEAEIGV